MWKVININKSNVEYETAKATLIKMPNKSTYKNYMFWHPSKLIRSGIHEASLTLSYTDDFEFKIFKQGKGKYNKYEVLDEKIIGALELEDAFEVLNDNINSKNVVYQTHKPQKLEPEKSKVLKELLDE